ncbi:MAG: hypothetical protein GDA46_03970 [Bdellovibrionales bacterium]|nr:hypothetical protein [Bdellovibrionales bacterium]
MHLSQLKNVKKKQHSSSNHTLGYQIKSLGKFSHLLKKMKLKKGDVLLSINNQPLSNKQDFYQILYSLLKKQNPFQIILNRKGEKKLLNYKIQSHSSGKYKLQVSYEKFPEQKKIYPEENKLAKSLVPQKYKPHLQRAYINRMNSFVYSQPNFDTRKLYSLPLGKHVLISKKIFLPTHSFGSFYKIFLFKKKKLIGYVSEAEVIPEFFKKDNKYVSNPNYYKAKRYKNENKILKIEDLENIVTQKEKIQLESKSLKTSKKYLGFFLGLNNELIFSQKNPVHFFAGLKLSTYSISLNTDFNLGLNSNKEVKSDFLIGFSFLKTHSYSLSFLGGLNGSLESISCDGRGHVFLGNFCIDYGLTGAFSFLRPLSQNILLKVEPKIEYQINKKKPFLTLIASLQFGF